jgi:hypothetical protein
LILQTETEIRVISRTLKYYLEKGYPAQVNQILKVKVQDLTPQSTALIKVKCDFCDQEKEITYRKYNNNISKHQLYACSPKCSRQKVKLTMKEKYGMENYHNLEQRKQTCQDKYNDPHYRNIKQRIQTNLDRYGQEHVLNNQEILNKRSNTYLQKYGVEHPMQCKEILEQKKITSFIRYGDENYNNIKQGLITRQSKQLANLRDKFQVEVISYQDGWYEIKCKKGHIYKIPYDVLYKRQEYQTELCTICNPIGNHSSGLQKELTEFIQTNYKGEMKNNSKQIIPPLELDIYLPALKLAFEFNGLYWHNELHKDQKYHLHKTEACEDQEIQLIHIYEDDWLYKREIIESRILNLLGQSNKIYARKCELKEVSDNKLIRQFLVENHLQGFVGSKVKIGLFYDNQLISLMTLGKKRKAMNSKSKEGEWELLRFCNQRGLNVVGGASKLFKYFIRKYQPKEVISYADRSWSQGKLYEKLGFKYINKTQPNYYYIIERLRRHRFNYRKDKLIKEGFDKNKTEHEIMLERGLYRIYDSGSLKYAYEG